MQDRNANRPGYKKTKAGWIPHNWEVLRVKDAGKVQAGRQRSPNFKEGELHPYLRVANIYDGYIDSSDVKQMMFTEEEFNRYRLHKGDILLNEGQSLDLVGRCAKYMGVPPDCCFQNTLVRFRPNGYMLDDYCQILFSHLQLSGAFAKIASRTTSIAHLGVSRFANLNIPIPKIEEQKIIAEVLSSWGGVLDKTDKLITAKKNQKKAIIQHFFSGQLRLPSFRAPWRTYRLKDIASVVFSNVDKKISSDEMPVNLCNYMDVYQKRCITAIDSLMRGTVKRSEFEKYKLCKHDVMITKDSETVQDIAVPCYVEENIENLVCGYHLGIIKPQREIAYGPFLSYLLLSENVHRKFMRIANGVTRFGLPLDAVKNIKITMPTIEEQKRIAGVLSAADEEIEYLEHKLTILEKQKRGLMQKLLTGEVRVKV